MEHAIESIGSSFVVALGRRDGCEVMGAHADAAGHT
jgi:hypothetical protein